MNKVRLFSTIPLHYISTDLLHYSSSLALASLPSLQSESLYGVNIDHVPLLLQYNITRPLTLVLDYLARRVEEQVRCLSVSPLHGEERL